MPSSLTDPLAALARNVEVAAAMSAARGEVDALLWRRDVRAAAASVAAASVGADAQPWFRLFSPERQAERDAARTELEGAAAATAGSFRALGVTPSAVIFRRGGWKLRVV